jgi:hypothetical protein
VTDDNCGTGGLCLPSGACAASDSIIHAVASNGALMGPCGSTSTPCTLTAALAVVDATKNVIKLDPGTYAPEMNNFVVGIDVTIDARGAILHKKDNGPILMISNGKTTTIFGGTIESATGAGGDGIQCNTATLTVHGTTIQMNDESAIEATNCTLTAIGAEIRGNSTKSSSFPGIQSSGGSLTISRSSIVSNRGGGISANNNGTFQIVGNVFLSNGDSGGIVGGLSLTTTVSGNHLEFNTITQNTSDMAFAAGIQCTVSGGFTAQNNIIWNNNSAVGTNATQVSGCLYAYSDIGPALTPTGNDGGNNLNVDPSFVNVSTDLHLQPATPIRSAANPAADLMGIASKDLDGNVRVPPATPGAYVAPPQ